MKWRSREKNKFDSGKYEPLPWSNQPWWFDSRASEIHKLHYAHPSKKEPGMIAYTASPEQGMDNKRTRIKPGRYLEQHFKDILTIYGVNIKRLTEDFSRIYEPRTVLFAKTDEEVVWLYENGPPSCMGSTKYRTDRGYGWPGPGQWPLNTHACTAYLAGDLQVAYLTEDDTPRGRIVARGVVWPEKKTHSRLYGDEVRLKNSLHALGYKHASPIGAKIKRVEVPDSNGMFLMPYIDAGDRSGTGSMAVKDKKTHFIVCAPVPGSYPANSTNGITGRPYNRDMQQSDHHHVNCQRCERHTDEAGGLSRCYRSGAPGDYRMWCDDCMDDHGFYCASTDRYYDPTVVEQVTMPNGDIWSAPAFAQYGFTCAGSGERHSNNDRIVLADGTRWCQAYYQDHGFQCAYTGSYYPNTQRVMLADGHAVCEAVLAQFGFTCSHCERMFLNSQKRGTVCVHCVEVAATAQPTQPISPEERV